MVIKTMGLPKDTLKGAGESAGAERGHDYRSVVGNGARADTATVLQELASRLEGLSQAEAERA